MPQARRLARGLLRQVVERQQHQDGGDHLDRELGQGEVGGGEVDEGQRRPRARRRWSGPAPAGDGGGSARTASAAARTSSQSATAGRLTGMVAPRARRHAVPPRKAVSAYAEHHQDRQQQAALQRAIVDRIGQAAGRGRRHWRSRLIEDRLGLRARQRLPHGADGPIGGEQQQAAGQRHRGHEQGRRHAVPKRQMVVGQRCRR